MVGNYTHTARGLWCNILLLRPWWWWSRGLTRRDLLTVKFANLFQFLKAENTIIKSKSDQKSTKNRSKLDHPRVNFASGGTTTKSIWFSLPLHDLHLLTLTAKNQFYASFFCLLFQTPETIMSVIMKSKSGFEQSNQQHNLAEGDRKMWHSDLARLSAVFCDVECNVRLRLRGPTIGRKAENLDDRFHTDSTFRPKVGPLGRNLTLLV